MKIMLEKYSTTKNAIDSLTDSSNIKAALDLDSLDLVEMVMAVEEEFSVIIPDEDAEKLQTFGQMTDYIMQHVPA